MYTPSSTAFLRPTRGGGFEFVEYDNSAFPYPQTIGSTAQSISGLGPADEKMMKTIFIMPNKGTDSTATLMIVVDEKEPSTDPKTYQYVYVGNINDLPSDVLTESSIVNDLDTGGTDKPLSAEQGRTLNSHVNYTTCGSGAGDQVKLISDDGFELSTHLRLLVIMTNTNTHSTPKFNINNTGVKDVWYNGSIASDTNTWSAGEVLDVYYDGNKYIATPYLNVDNEPIDRSENLVKSGGVANKTRNCEYSANSVTDEVIEVDISSNVGVVLSDGTLDINITSPYRYSDFIPVSSGEFLSVQNVLIGSSSMFIVSMYSTNSQSSVDISHSISGGNNDFVEFTIPDGINYIRVCTRDNFNVSIYKSGVIKNLQNHEAEINNLKNRLSLNDFNVQKITAASRGVIMPDGSLVTNPTSSYTYSDFIPVVSNRIYNLWWIKSFNTMLVVSMYTSNDQNSIDLSKCIQKTFEGTLSFKIPEGINYIRFCNYYNSGNVTEFYLSYNDNISNIIYELQEQGTTIQSHEAEIQEQSTIIQTHENELFSNITTIVDVTNVGVVLSSDGTLDTNQTSPYRYSDFIPVTPGEIYNIGNIAGYSSMFVVSMYASSSQSSISMNNCIAGDGSIHTYILTIPEGVNYIRLCNRPSLNDTSYIEVTGKQSNIKVIERQLNYLTNKSISILFIGNSLTQDAVSYLPLIMKELCPNVDFKFYIWYNGGKTLEQQYNNYFLTNTPCEIFSICENGTSWTNYNNSKTMSWILSNYVFDVVSLQEYFNYKETYTDTTDFENCVNYIKNNYSKAFRVVNLFHQPKRDIAESVYSLTKSGNELILKQTESESIIPAGIAIYKAMQEPTLDSLGDQGHLSPDGTHSQEGLPCLLQAWCVFDWLSNFLSIPISVTNSKTRITSTNYPSINVPGPNLGTGVVQGTEAQNLLAQKVAVIASKIGKRFDMEAINQIS